MGWWIILTLTNFAMSWLMIFTCSLIAVGWWMILTLPNFAMAWPIILTHLIAVG
jgi:hypothetical protein